MKIHRNSSLSLELVSWFQFIGLWIYQVFKQGVMYIMEECEMPVGVLDDGSEIEFDIVMSLSSVVNRQTLGQYFEMVRGELVHKGLEAQHIIGATERETRH